MQTLLLSLALSLTGQATALDFKTFKPDDGGWEVKLPGNPKKTTNSVKTAVGPVEMTIYMVESGNNAYGVIYNDYEVVQEGVAEKVLDGAMTGAINGLKAKLLKSNKIQLGDVPGLSFEFELNGPDGNQMIGRYRFYLAGKRLYQLVLLADPETARSGESTKMLNSFKLTSKAVTAKAVKVPSMALKPFKSEDGKWEASLPGTPKASVNKTKTDLGDLDLNIFMVERGNDAYAVMYSEVPGAKQTDSNTFLEAAENGGVSAVKGKLVKSKNIKLDGFPGREFEYEVPNPGGPSMVGRQRIFLVGDVLYQVIVVAAPETARNGISTRILESFKLTGKTPAAKPKLKGRR